MSKMAPQGGFGGTDNPVLSSALISTRDGIVGAWDAPDATPDARTAEHA